MLKTVVVTGANGHIGNNLTELLLQRSYHVRALVRGPTAAGMLAHLRVPTLEIVYGDLLEKGALEQAFKGATGVFHVAAPNSIWARDVQKDIVRPIVTGTINVLEAARNAGVTRVVFTSSCSASGLRAPIGGLIDESQWLARVHSPLLQAKIDAERAAWDFVRTCDLGLSTLLLPSVVGPKFFRHTPSTLFYARLMQGHPTPLPRVGFHILDARDAALAHVLAFERGRSGQRYIVAGEFVTTDRLYEAIRISAPQLRVPSRPIPDWLVYGGVLIDWARHRCTGVRRELTLDLARDLIGIDQRVSTEKMAAELGLAPRPLGVTLSDLWAWLRQKLQPLPC